MATAIEDVFKGVNHVEKTPGTDSGKTEIVEALTNSSNAADFKTDSSTPETPAPVETVKAESNTVTTTPAATPEKGLIRAVQEERRKRQAIEQELQTLRSQSMVPPPDVYSDPATYVKQSVEQVRGETRGVLTSMSEAMARRAYPDFQEKYDVFAEAVAQNPSLLEVVMASELPGEAVYQTGKQLLFEREFGRTPEEIQANMEKKLRPKLKSEIEAEILGKLKGKNNQTTNILTSRAAGGSTQAEWQPARLSDVFKKR
jgi:hypothetical protein